MTYTVVSLHLSHTRRNKQAAKCSPLMPKFHQLLAYPNVKGPMANMHMLTSYSGPVRMKTRRKTRSSS